MTSDKVVACCDHNTCTFPLFHAMGTQLWRSQKYRRLILTCGPPRTPIVIDEPHMFIRLCGSITRGCKSAGKPLGMCAAAQVHSICVACCDLVF